jgi:nickel/cobalt transporter (NicO) family protein
VSGRRGQVLVGIAAGVVMAVIGATPAAAHPLGNFSINHLDSLRFEADRIIDDAVIDTAEIPTAQAADIVDADGNGTTTTSEFDSYGREQCEVYRESLSLTADSRAVPITTISTSFGYRPGQAGLQTSRLECHFEAVTTIRASTTVEFSNAFATNRIGWHEITATAVGTRLIDSPVAETSVTNGLTSYPVDLLSSPLDLRTASFTAVPGPGESTHAATSHASPSAFSRALGPFSRVVDRINKTFDDLVGRRQLTLGVGLLAIGLAMILGASHALLPGHGKTVMAAYIAGRQGSVRDAVLVGATVTATHTGGVLILGLALTLSSSLAGESVLAWLGVISGLMIAALGASLLIGAARRRSSGSGPPMHGHGHGHSHSFGHSHGHSNGHTHSGGVDLVEAGWAAVAAAERTSARGGSSLTVLERPVEHHHDHDRHDHDHDHDRHDHDHGSKRFSRRGLIGMGIAGGLVPSPSALVVLLSAIALGRTIFGVVLVVGYGAGMAGTLTLAGVLLVRVRDRSRRRAATAPSRIRSIAERWTKLAPYATAALVLVVGLGLALRSVGSI